MQWNAGTLRKAVRQKERQWKKTKPAHYHDMGWEEISLVNPA